MQNILIYDVEAEAIEKVCDANDMTEAEVVEMLCEYLDDMMRENGLN